MIDYLSDQERGPRLRVSLEIESPAWGGIIALVDQYMANGGFGVDFPATCPDGRGPIGADPHAFSLALVAEIPDISWPLSLNVVPDALSALDLIQFCFEHVAEPAAASYHKFFDHSHLRFDRLQGRVHFRDKVNRILSRNGIAYSLEPDGKIERIAPPILDETLHRSAFGTGEATLDRLLEIARRKFLSPDPTDRREALEQLWDAWERLKTLEIGANKRASTEALLDKAAGEENFRSLLEHEASALTSIGNRFRIRHSETTQSEIQTEAQVDYLFHRLLAMILLLVRARLACE